MKDKMNRMTTILTAVVSILTATISIMVAINQLIPDKKDSDE